MRHFISKIQFILLILVIVLFLVSCNVKRKSIATITTTITDSIDVIQTSKIIFLTYSMQKKETSEEYDVIMINKLITEGKLKERYIDSITPAVGDLVYKIVDQNNGIIKQNFIQNPTKKTAEYVTSEGVLTTTEIILDSTEFFLRFQLHPNAKYIVLEKYGGKESANIYLLTTKL